MTDPRDLAERICEELFEGNPAVDTPYELMCVERILREDREALAQAMVVPEYEHWSPKWVEDTKDFGIWWMSIRAQKILRGEIVLKGGEQAERNQDDATSDPRDPAAPDPHEYLELNGRCVHLVPSPLDGGASATHCGRPADDPIHTQPTDDDSRDVSPAYVGPGDEVQVHLENLVLEPTEVVGPNRQVVGAIVVQLRRGVFASYMVHYLRTPDGRPVAGFRESKFSYDFVGGLRQRIADLERERDEARGQRDRVLQQYHNAGLVQLDDEDIERVAKLAKEKWTSEDWDCFTVETVRTMLRDLRDGKL